MSLSKWLDETRNTLTYQVEGAILDFTEELLRLMEDQNMSRSDLAEAIGSSPAYITKVLSGNANFTLATMTKLARPLGAVVHIHLGPEEDVKPKIATINSQEFLAETPAPLRAISSAPLAATSFTVDGIS